MGGLAKHMMHPHDDLNLTLGDLKQLVRGTFNGSLPLKEKLDGFNIHFFRIGNDLRMARNVHDLRCGGFGYEDIDYRFPVSHVQVVFKDGYDWMKEHLEEISIPDFQETGQTLNCEILCDMTNVVYYSTSGVFIHNIFQWSLPNLTPKVRVYKGKYASPIVYMNPQHYVDVEKLITELDSLWKDCGEIFSEAPLDQISIRQYYQVRYIQWWNKNYPNWISHPVFGDLFNRWFYDGPKVNLRDLRKKYSHLNLDEYLVLSKTVVHDVKQELDHWVLKVGNLILTHVHGYVNEVVPGIKNIKAIEVVQEDINQVSSCLASVDLNHPALKIFKERFQASGNQVQDLEGVVLKYKGNRYKWTGSFAPINKLMHTYMQGSGYNLEIK